MEDEIGGLQVDEEAAAFVTKLKQRHGGESPAFIDFTQTKIIRLGSNEYSDLEKKYRIEGNLC